VLIATCTIPPPQRDAPSAIQTPSLNSDGCMYAPSPLSSCRWAHSFRESDDEDDEFGLEGRPHRPLTAREKCGVCAACVLVLVLMGLASFLGATLLVVLEPFFAPSRLHPSSVRKRRYGPASLPAGCWMAPRGCMRGGGRGARCAVCDRRLGRRQAARRGDSRAPLHCARLSRVRMWAQLVQVRARAQLVAALDDVKRREASGQVCQRPSSNRPPSASWPPRVT
jgi:hypothetical protein